MAYKQKLIKIGNSLGITLPSLVIKELGWKKGTEIAVEPDFDKKIIIIAPSKFFGGWNLTAEFHVWLHRAIKKYDNALRTLAGR